MSTLMLCSASGAEDGGGDARPVVDAQHGDPRLVPAVGDPADDLAFHDLILVGDQRARPVVEARQHLHPDLVLHGQRHRAGLQHLGPERGHLQHLLVGDAVELAGLGDDARVGGVDAVDIGEDVAAVRAQGGGQRHGRGVRAAAAERGHPALRRTGPGSRPRRRPCRPRGKPRTGRGVDVQDPGLAVGAVGSEAGLPAEERPRRHADGLQGDGQQPDRHLLAAGDDLIVLGRVVAGGVEPMHPARPAGWSSRPSPRRRPPPARRRRPDA